ncbi:MAG: site-specific DNA-methyltransferase [Saprospiraceae bacterium]
MFYNVDCIEGAKKFLNDASVDLIISDPPYGIGGDMLHKHYNRNEKFVLDGYIEVPQEEYYDFTYDWIMEAERVLKPGGSIYIVSGYTNLIHILNALSKTQLKEVNHIIWKYNFGVYTKNKYISSHYHILYYVKPGPKPIFNTFSRFSDSEKESESNGSLNYQDREDVWIINREYKPGQVKNKNELPTQLLSKIIQYSSNEGDLVCDFFLGSFSTAKVAIGLNRNACGFEKSQVAFSYQINEIEKVIPGSLLESMRTPPASKYFRQGKPIDELEKKKILNKYEELKNSGMPKKMIIKKLGDEIGRGPWSLEKIISSYKEQSKNGQKLLLE